MHANSVRSRASSFLINSYRRSHILRWLRGLTLRNHWRQIHTRNSCIYGASLTPFMADMLARMVGTRPCDGRVVENFESTFAAVVGTEHSVTFSSGRNSLRAILKAMEIGAGDEVIVPGFTCAVVPYTILHCGARPVYVDIQDDYRVNLEVLRSALTDRTKALIAQHTFGLPERMSEIVKVAKTRGIRVIEDCAHVLPGSVHEGKALGTWGDAAYFSFERGKTISSGWGGAAITSNPEIGRSLDQIKQSVPPLNRADNLRIATESLLTILLHHPNLFALSNLIRRWVYKKGQFASAVPLGERQGEPPTQPLGRLADIQATLLLSQLRRLSSIAEHRRSCVRALSERLGGSPIDLPLMWYPFQVENRDEAVRHFLRYQIELRTWAAPLTPPDCDTARALYRWGSCPMAEEISRGCVAFPTMLNRADLDRVVDVASRYLHIVPID